MKNVCITLASLALTSACFGQSRVFDAMDAYDYFSGPLGNGAFMGETINQQGELFGLASGTTQITGFDIDLFSGVTLRGSQFYSDIRLMASFFPTGNQSIFTNTGQEFGSPVETVTFDLGARTLNNSTVYSYSGTPTNPFFLLPTPVAVSGATMGVVFTWLADTGSGLGAVTTLQTSWLASSSIAPSVGYNGFQTYQMCWGEDGGTNSAAGIPQAYWVYNGTTQLNLGVRLYGTPEPASFALLSLGLVGIIARRRKTHSRVRSVVNALAPLPLDTILAKGPTERP